MFKTKKVRIALIVAVILVLVGTFYTLPYYITRPGSAMELSPIVFVEDGDESEQGEFMLTTVLMGKANVFSYLLAKVKDYYYIYKEEDIRQEDETDEEYYVRQLYMMTSAKLNAIETAFTYANIPYEATYKGVYVLSVLDTLPASKIIQAGDSITKINGEALKASEQLIEYVSNRKVGDVVNLTIVRDGKEQQVDVELGMVEENRVGIGITLVDDKEIITQPEVFIDSSDIGGPSAGLMFSLEIYSQLQEGDLTKGYNIAGTGTISAEGKVGPIGGVEQKVVAADNSNADIFFAPLDNGNPNSDYVNAKKAAENIGTDMQIVGVNTFEDAINYLNSLDPK